MLTGIVVGRRHHGPVVRGPSGPTLPETREIAGALYLPTTTDFEEFFAPLHPLLAEYAWLLEDVIFGLPESWEKRYDPETESYRGPEIDEFESFTLAELGEDDPCRLRLVRPGFLDRYARYMNDDWCQLAGVRLGKEDPAVLLQEARAESVALWKLPAVDVWFQNVDGGPWRMVTSRPELVQVVREHLRSRSDIEVRDLAARQRT